MPSPQYQRNQASLRALKHQCLFDFDFRRELLSRTRLSHQALEMKSSSHLTDGALAEWEASLKTPRSAERVFFSNLHALPAGVLLRSWALQMLGNRCGRAVFKAVQFRALVSKSRSHLPIQQQVNPAQPNKTVYTSGSPQLVNGRSPEPG
jgi:hypothetical protein